MEGDDVLDGGLDDPRRVFAGDQPLVDPDEEEIVDDELDDD